METTNNGVQKAQFQEINLSSFNNNASILDEHLSNEDIHVNTCNIAGVAEADELKQIDFTDTNSTMWGKIKKSISEVTNHVDKVASETTLGHIKIGTGLQMTDDVASVKIADDLKTDDSTTALSAAMGVELSDTLNCIGTILSQNNTFSITEVETWKTIGELTINKSGNYIVTHQTVVADVSSSTRLLTQSFLVRNGVEIGVLTGTEAPVGQYFATMFSAKPITVLDGDIIRVKIYSSVTTNNTSNSVKIDAIRIK